MSWLKTDNPLIRQGWVLENLLSQVPYSYTGSFAGGTSASIIHQYNEKKGNGHVVVFQDRGGVEGNWKIGKETVRGTGEEKKLFETTMLTSRIRTEVKNDDKFEAIEIDDLRLSEHQDSMQELAKMWVAAKDQAFFDVCQQSASHRIILGNDFTFSDFGKIERIVKTGDGYYERDKKTLIKTRRPMLQSWKTRGGDRLFNQYLLLIDPYMKEKLLGGKAVQDVLAQADVRGNENRLINGVIGKIGTNITVVELPLFDGWTESQAVGDFVNTTAGATDSFMAKFEKTHLKADAQGLRIYTGANDSFVPTSWTGDGLTEGAKKFSRALLIGAGAVQLGYGKMPEYNYAESPDYGIDSTSMLEVWTGMRARVYNAVRGDYKTPIANMTFGIIAIDMQID